MGFPADSVKDFWIVEKWGKTETIEVFSYKHEWGQILI